VGGYDGQFTRYNLLNPWQPGFGGDEYGVDWHLITFDLQDYVGESVTIYFDFGASTRDGAPGWYINDIALYDVPVAGVAPSYPATLPVYYLLLRSYPNPFNSSTEIEYTIPEIGNTDKGYNLTRIDIYDINGRLVKNLVHQHQMPGTYQARWDGTDDSGQNLQSGVYFTRLSYNGNQKFNKTILIK